MTNTEAKITNAQNLEEQEKLKAKYEQESQAKEQEILKLRNTITNKNDEIFELQKANKSLAKDRDEWKSTAHTARKIQTETKQHKEAQDFQTEYLKLQAQKGWQWSESQGWTKAK
jgi:chromosome segregation ATPase